eukprot:TRINITY_DN50229_c0_g1_i1.p1 TRINITY_DN50229_c0_g1~~TRINITY_DN50229_c0_g1_i1.p1  ORF type:complete len:217 (-),score=37.19 TRINITY_DN50229_c0_g1_i1:219-869(-)
MGGEQDGLSGHAIPAEYGEISPFFTLSALYVLPTTVLSLALTAGAFGVCACKICSLLGAAYAFGSNVWLLRYGPRMFKVCSKESSWLGKEAFSTIQAACFPEYFSLQTASCVLALGGYLGAAEGVASIADTASLAMIAAVIFALINQFVLGPKTTKLMVKLYEPGSCQGGGTQPLLDSEAKKAVKRNFGMIHGTSMLIDLFNLASVFAFICKVACQ